MLILGLLGVQAAYAKELFPLEEFGSHTGTQSWVVIAPPSEVDRLAVTRSTLRLAQNEGLSLAYSQDANSVVWVYDPAGLFNDLYETLTPGSDRALVTRELAAVADPAPGWQVVGEAPDDLFWSAPPYWVFPIDADSLGPGYFLFTGPTSTDWAQVGVELEALWRANELEVVESQTRLPPTRLDPKPIYWPVLAVIVAAPALSLAILTRLHVLAWVPRYRLAAVNGLNRLRVAIRLLGRLVAAWLPGGLLGGAAILLAPGSTDHYPWTPCLIAGLFGAACCVDSAARASWRISREVIC